MTRTRVPLVVVAVVVLLFLDVWLALGAMPTQTIPTYSCPIDSGANAPAQCAP
jgi:hypothetical protein